MSNADIDNLPTQHHLIDLQTQFESGSPVMAGYEIEAIMHNQILVQPVDESEDGEAIYRDGVWIPKNAVLKAWRVGKVILVGNGTKDIEPGQNVIFPHDMGIPCKNVNVADVGVLKSGHFLDRDRVFGICRPIEITYQ